MMLIYPFRNTFLTQFVSVNIRSREFPITPTNIFMPREGADTAMSLLDDDAPTLVGDTLDQVSKPEMVGAPSLIPAPVFEAPNTALDLPGKNARDNTSKEGDITSGRWNGRHNGNRACVKRFRTHASGVLSKLKQRLFREIVIWRGLSHPNILPMLGVSPKLFPPCLITEWIMNGNVMDFTRNHLEVNRLHLLAEASRGLEYLHSIHVIHGRLKPANILIDRDCRPRLADYGLPLQFDVVGELHHCDDLQYLAPELLDPSSFGLRKPIPTEESDVFAFGMVIYQVLTGLEPFPGAKHSIVGNVVGGARPHRPPGPSEWLSDNVWDLVCGCWPALRASRPDAGLVMNALNNAGNIIEFKRSEPDLIALLDVSKTGANGNPEVKRAQELVDLVDLMLENGDPDRQNRRRYLKHLRKLCGIFAILPSSFTLAPTLDKCEAAPFDSGGSSDVYKATFEGRPVVIKTLKISGAADPKEVHKLLVKEVVGWKWLRHENILPFVGVTFTPPLISIVSERMENGNIMEFVRAHPNNNRLQLLAGAVTGLEYLHEHDIVHGDLKGANILIDSDCRARLADFGLAVVADESVAGSTVNHRGVGGTIRWMAPEVMYPEMFGFTGEHRKRLPSRSTDIYALGMTILEVITGCHPFDSTIRDAAVMYRVLEGGRPNRPPSGFSDRLWELLANTWCVEYGSQPSKRPSATTVLHLLKGEPHNWGKSMIPPQLVQPQNRFEDAGTVMDGRSDSEDGGPDNAQTDTVALPTPPPFHTPQADPNGARIADNAEGSIRGFLGRLLRFLANPHKINK